MAVTQRPVTEGGLSETSGGHSLWHSVPSWFIFGELDKKTMKQGLWPSHHCYALSMGVYSGT